MSMASYLRLDAAYSPVGGHEHFDVSPRIETIQLVDQFQHRSLDLIITTCPIIETSTTDSVDLIEEDDAGFLTPSHLKQLPDHTCTFSNILLDEF